MSGNPPFAIRKTGTDLWLNTTIDSSGMSVFWGSIFHKDEFESREAAEQLKRRVLERYPHENLEVIPHDI